MKNIDIFDKFATDGGYFGEYRLKGDTYFCNPVLPAGVDHRFRYKGQTVISWSLNNYLGLANNSRVKRVTKRSVRRYGPSSPMGSRMLTGTTRYHLELEERLAHFAQKEGSYVFNYGYLGVLGTICSMVGSNDTIVIDKLTHACIVDAALLSQANIRIFKHNNMEDLEKILKRINRVRKGGLLIAVEGVYGMTGDIANLKAMTRLARAYEARLFVDDAHGWGVMGDNGRGAGEFHGVHDEIDLYFGTFAKAFASIGGMVATTRAARNWIAFNARTQVFAKALPIAYVHSLQKTLELIERADARRQRMWEISNILKQRMRDEGYMVGMGESPICSIFVPMRDERHDRVAMYARWLREHGIFVSVVVYPVIPRDMAMFRLVPTAHHTMSDIERTVRGFQQLREAQHLTLDMTSEELARVKRIYRAE